MVQTIVSLPCYYSQFTLTADVIQYTTRQRLIFLVEPCRSRGLLFPLIIHNDTHSARLLWTRDQPVSEAFVRLTHNIHKRKMSVPRAG